MSRLQLSGWLGSRFRWVGSDSHWWGCLAGDELGEFGLDWVGLHWVWGDVGQGVSGSIDLQAAVSKNSLYRVPASRLGVARSAGGARSPRVCSLARAAEKIEFVGWASHTQSGRESGQQLAV